MAQPSERGVVTDEEALDAQRIDAARAALNHENKK